MSTFDCSIPNFISRNVCTSLVCSMKESSWDCVLMRRLISEEDMDSMVGKEGGIDGIRASISSSETSKIGFGFGFFSFWWIGG